MSNRVHRLSSRAKALVRLVAGGMPTIDAARKMGYSRNWAYEVMRSKAGKDYRAFMEQELERAWIAEQLAQGFKD